MVEFDKGGKPEADAGVDLAELTATGPGFETAQFGTIIADMRHMEPGTLSEFPGGFSFGTTAQQADMDDREQDTVPKQVKVGTFRFGSADGGPETMAELVDLTDGNRTVELPYQNGMRMLISQSSGDEPVIHDGEPAPVMARMRL